MTQLPKSARMLRCVTDVRMSLVCLVQICKNRRDNTSWNIDKYGETTSFTDMLMLHLIEMA